MIYIYDVALNFQKYYCEFYEWKREDKISNIRKIPLYRVSYDIFNCLQYNDVVVSDKFLECVRKDYGNSKRLMCLVSDGDRGLGVLINQDGRVIKRSSMLYDEEDEVCGYALELDCLDINFIKNKECNVLVEPRFCWERRRFLINYLKKIDNDILWKYLYYECYKDEIDDLDIIKKTLLDVVNKGYSNVNQKLYDSIMLFSKIKN